MMSIVLEFVNPQEPAEVEEPAKPTAPEPSEEAALAPSVETEALLTQLEEIPEHSAPEPPTPAPKKRGRPPKVKAVAKAPRLAKAKPAPKPRARKPPPPESDSDSSSDVEETLKNVYKHVAKPDTETAILEFLVNRKTNKQSRRRDLWSRLARNSEDL